MTSIFAAAPEANDGTMLDGSNAESGFTLIELMVVLLIIAILLAIAIPTFLGVSGSARDRAAQSNLTNALTEAIAYYEDGQTYDASSGQSSAQLNTLCSQDTAASGCSNTPPALLQATFSVLGSQEFAFTWGTNSCTAANASKCVSVLPVDVSYSGDGQGIILAMMSGSGACWYALDVEATPASYTVGGPDVASNTGVFAGQTSVPLTAGGRYFATENGSSVTCSAAHAQGFANWYGSYASAKSE